MEYCPDCATEVNSSGTYCPSCGEEVRDAVSKDEEKAKFILKHSNKREYAEDDEAVEAVSEMLFKDETADESHSKHRNKREQLTTGANESEVAVIMKRRLQALTGASEGELAVGTMRVLGVAVIMVGIVGFFWATQGIGTYSSPLYALHPQREGIGAIIRLLKFVRIAAIIGILFGVAMLVFPSLLPLERWVEEEDR